MFITTRRIIKYLKARDFKSAEYNLMGNLRIYKIEIPTTFKTIILVNQILPLGAPGHCPLNSLQPQSLRV